MTSFLPPRTFSLSPFKKSVDFDPAVTDAKDGNSNIPAIISGHKKAKRRSLKIITRSIEGSQSNNTSSSPSKTRSRFSSFLKAISPVTATTFSAKHSSFHKQQRLSDLILPSQSNISFVSTDSQLSMSRQQPRQHQNEEYSVGNTTSASFTSTSDPGNKPRLSGTGDASSFYDDSSFSSADNIPISPKDDFIPSTAYTPSVHQATLGKERANRITSADKTSIVMNNPMTQNATKAPPPPLPIHRHTLSFHVSQVLGSALKEVDEEIEKDWEQSRRLLRQSLTLPITYNERLQFYR